MIKIKNSLCFLLKLSILLLPIVFLCCVINIYAVDSLQREDFLIIDEYINIVMGKIDWSIFFSLNNEHVILIPKIIIFVMAYFSDYNTKTMLIGSVLLLTMIYFFFIRYTVGKKFINFNFGDILYSLAVGFCLCSAKQYENLLWNFQIAWFLIEFCLVVGLIMLSLYINTHQKKYLLGAIILAFFASFSCLHGLEIWLCYMGVIAVYQLSEKSFDKKIWFYIITACLTTFYLYMYNYLYGFYGRYIDVTLLRESRADSFTQMLAFFFKDIGSIFLDFYISDLNVFYGIIELVVFFVLFLILFKTRQIKHNIVPLGCVFYALVFAASIAFGRANISGGIASRYTTYSILAVVGIFAILKLFIKADDRKSDIAVFIFFIMFISCMYSNVTSFNPMESWHLKELKAKEILLNYKTSTSDDVQNIIYPKSKIYEEAIQDIQKIDNARLSVFKNK